MNEAASPAIASVDAPVAQRPKPKRLRGRLFLKYVALFFIVVLVALLTSGVFQVWFYYQEHKASLIRIQREQAEAAAAKIGQFIKEIESQVGWTTQLPWSTGTLDQRRFDGLRLLRQVPAITELSQLDSQGREQLRVSRLAMDVVGSQTDFSKDPKFAEAIAKKVYYGPVYFRRESEPYMTLALAGARRDAGVSVAEVNLKLIWDVISQIKVGQRGHAYVVDAQGRLIAHPDISLVLRNTDLSRLTQVQAARASTAGTSREHVQEATDIQGREVLTAYAPVAPLGWLVFVELPFEEAYAPLRASVERLGLLLLSGLMLASFGGLFLARRMVGPIQALRAGAARIGSGDLGQRIAVKTGDELEALADQFNDMAGRLQESYAGLEQKVAQRTHELSKSLAQQTATSEVLRVISSSPGDLKPVFEAMLENATRICGAEFGNLFLYEEGTFRSGAMYAAPSAYSEWWQQGALSVSDHPLSMLARVAAAKKVVHVADLREDRGYIERDSRVVTLVEAAGARTLVSVPMLKEDELIGAIAIYRQEVRPFTDKQIALVTSFANQAVIAIENVRLLSELRARTDELARSVGELRALGEVGQMVNSTLEVEGVLNTIVAKAVQLSGTEAGAIYVTDAEHKELRLRATHGMSAALIAALTEQGVAFGEATVAQAVAQRAPVQVSDLREVPASPVQDIIMRAGYRALLVVPLLSPEGIVGMLVVRRRAPGAFPQSTIDVLQTFAAQSVVAIQNARLFSEVEEKGQQLAIASQHKSQFLANMSHELRTPLNAIIGYSEILQEEVEEVGQDRFTPDLKRIEQSGRHLLGLINDILDLSKIEAGRMDLFLEDIEIAPLLEEVRAIIRPLAEKNGNVLAFRLSEDLSSMRTDRTKLKQSLLNVLSNASKFTENGRLTLVAERFEADRPMIRFAISDTGIGMSEQQLGRLFQAFSQVDASTTKKYGGTGLGLAITRHFCQLLGGDIEATSRPGEGSTFTITLPDRATMATPIEASDLPRLPAEDDHATTVLIVDDDPAARDLLTTNLKAAGYRLLHAASGEEALKLARTARPDAITLDVVMPKMDGWAVLSALKADVELSDIPVVMVTVLAERGLGLSLGAVDVLTKPVDRGDLMAVLHRLLRREGPVLVVEDDAGARKMMRHTIERMGLTMAEAANGRSALEWLADGQTPAVVLLDLLMPEMDGFEFLDAFTARSEWRDVPVIVITAKELTTAERERLLREAQKVIVKGGSIGIDIAAAVSEAVRRRPAAMATVSNA